MIELLAPAKDKVCAKAAIDYGADAIYIGANEFGARQNASNSLEDIKQIVEYAHKFNVKVYITINTILTDDEIIKAKELIKKLSKISVDAIIIQDMGLVELMKPFNISTSTESELLSSDLELPPYHASTQCDNRTPEKVKFLENVGFSRVILARELSIKQIKGIKKQTNVELETFIHGALCVSYSGQCYLSHMIGGRSSNRGQCAQPCRKKYSLVCEDGEGTKNFIAKDKYLLCLKDFNASKHIKALVEAGVTSFKIEGRLKDENYVKNVVAYYRKLIDNLAKESPSFKKTSSGKILLDFEPDVNKSFNRGFTDYFLEGSLKKGHDYYEFLSPKSKGEYIGKVTKVSKDCFEITFPSTSHHLLLTSQDGLCFFAKEELTGCLVNKVEGGKVYPNKMNGINVGTEIYRNFDADFEKKLKNSKTCRKISANIEFDLGKIKITDEDKNSIEIKYDFEELAQHEEKMVENIINQLKKSGESDFLVEDVEIHVNKTPFLPVSKINELRRELLEKLMAERLKNYKVKRGKRRSLQCHPPMEIDYRGNVLNKYAKEFYEDQGCTVVETALEGEKAKKNKNKYEGKCAMTTKHCLKYAFNMCKSPKKLYLLDEKGKKYDLKFNCDDCEMEIYF